MIKYASELTDFSDLLRATAQWKNIGGAIVEKDYYLTRALRALADHHSGQFILKGGTSLSKGWNLLQRFSEDVDLLLRTGRDPMGKDKRLKALQGSIEHTDGFKLESDISRRGVHRDAVFSYDGAANDIPGLSKTIKLELGYRGDPAAAISRPVRSIVTEFVESRGQTGLAADLITFQIEMQAVTRTFVEKLFAVHAAFESNKAEGRARHYYDLFETSKLPEIREFIGTENYRECVAEVREFSEANFAKQEIWPHNSFQACPALQPDFAGLKELDRNWRAEQYLYFGQQPPLADVLQALGELLPKL